MDTRRAIPAVDRLLATPEFETLLQRAPRRRVVDMLRQVQQELRREPADSDLSDPGLYAELVEERLGRSQRPTLRPLINATGVVLHTNLGRAPLARAALEAIARVAAGYSTLEYDLAEGQRGSRYSHCAHLLRELTGAEDALVVNNNAAALVLALATFADGRGALVSRGELVEIGDSFRIAEIVQRSGARLVEVGSTNRTHLSDYAAALDAGTGAILKVHRSNFRVTGFTAEATLAELAGLARENVPLVADLGSGLLIDPALLHLPPEPMPDEALRAGADIVTMSGDKLLGGPQAGIVLGGAELVGRMRRHPLCRALRVDKLTLAALEATLRLYLDPQRALAEIPTLRMLAMPVDEIATRAKAFLQRLQEAGIRASLQSGTSSVGGGAYPDTGLPTLLVTLAGTTSAEELERRLRAGAPPVVARIVGDRLALDLRTVARRETDALLRAVLAAHG